MGSTLKENIKEKIKDENGIIEERWLKLHYDTIMCSASIGLLAEGVLTPLLYYTSQRDIEIQALEYFVRYLFLPLAFVLILLLLSSWVKSTGLLSSQMKAYALSITMIGICFVFYSAHYNYNLNILFFCPILFTIIYERYTISTAVAALSILAKINSDLFVSWNLGRVHPLSDSSATIGFFVSLLALFVLYGISMLVIYFQKEKNATALVREIERRKIEKQLIMDPLTKIYNRVALKEALSGIEIERTENSYYFAMMDLDNFKNLNDTLGRGKGDQCLEEVGQVLKEFCEENTIPYRFGGDEFCILFTNKDEDRVMIILERIQERIRENITGKFGLPVSISIGVARYTDDMTSRQLMQRADIEMYKAKRKKGGISIHPLSNME